MTKEVKAHEYSNNIWNIKGKELAAIDIVDRTRISNSTKDFLAGFEAAESNQTQLIKAALLFAKYNYHFCFNEDMMYNLFMESIDPKNIPLPPPKNK